MTTQESNVLIVDFRPDGSISIAAGSNARPWESLSFVAGAENLWSPTRTGVYQRDCDAGRSYAAELLRHIERHGSPFVLGHVCRAMSEELWGGVEAGFFQALAEAATSNG
jgi:hypothetical protein